MALFQKSVLKKYINDLNKENLQTAWLLFQQHFHNAIIQHNILNAKEEEYQEGFVRDLFVNVLGYTLKPQPGYNLVMEQKSTSDSTKSDGAILTAAGHVTSVIELKDTNTTDLDKVVKQAFGYKHQHKDCVYVITANFEKLRFYINDAIDFEEFDLFRLTKERFAVLYCCLQQQAMHNDVPLKIKQQSTAAEENITQKLYADYSRFKQQLFASITQKNLQYNKLDLFKKTQKLLDRFLFILFVEDRLLLPPNSVRDILQQWEQLKELDNYVPLYDRFKKYFGYLNTSYQGKQYEIFAYNGGLFATDEILDSITIDDQLLYESCNGLSNYDFESEVDVNILGHIFEHSLAEIEEVEKELINAVSVIDGEGANTDLPQQEKKLSKRKKDGVFYTPRYITKYIVENTLGTLCSQQKETLQIIDDAFTPQKRKANTQQLVQKLEDYRQWLLQLTICDPACGSGAFLNQALEFLIAEHKSIDELKGKLFGDAMVLSNVEASILENNLYGVDINDEATEIAKLSLWLRTARKGRKLNNLNQHIKCGNSLIDDPAVAGDKAFNWQKEFPEVFAKGGFDVVIGNPPYVRSEFLNSMQKVFYKKFYKSANGQYDIYILFYELAFTILKQRGKLSYITPNKFLLGDYGVEIRRLLIRNTSIEEILDISMLGVFQDAAVYPIVYIGNNSIKADNCFKIKSRITNVDDFLTNDFFKVAQKNYDDDESFVINTNVKNFSILNKIEEGSIYLKKAYKITRGFRPPPEEFISLQKIDQNFYPFLKGDALSGPYEINWDGLYVNYIQNKIPESKNISFFTQPKVFIRDIGLKFNASFDNSNYLCLKTIYFIYGASIENLKSLTALLNSTLFNFYFKEKYSSMHIGGGYLRFRKQFLDELPLKQNNTFTDDLVRLCEKQIDAHLQLLYVYNQLTDLIKAKFEEIKISKKLQNWPDISFNDFLRELEKQKIKLTLPQQAEWMQYFEAEKAKANVIQQLIAQTDKEIDNMVYELYGLTEEERRIVEAG